MVTVVAVLPDGKSNEKRSYQGFSAVLIAIFMLLGSPEMIWSNWNLIFYSKNEKSETSLAFLGQKQVLNQFCTLFVHEFITGNWFQRSLLSFCRILWFRMPEKGLCLNSLPCWHTVITEYTESRWVNGWTESMKNKQFSCMNFFTFNVVH